jgi:DNA-binding NarL/FixJ family response regulator
MPEIRRLLLVDDHPLVRGGVRACLEATGHYRVCGEAGTPQEALQVLDAQPIDLVITDLRLAGGSGVDLIAALAERPPVCPSLVLSMLGDAAFVQRVLSLGARGYVLKDDPAQTLLAAIAAVARGEVFLSPALPPGLPAGLAGHRDRPQLSPREVQVLRLLAQGQTSRQIAEQLAMSVRTVESHRLRLRRKLHLDGPGSLSRYAQDYGLLEPGD